MNTFQVKQPLALIQDHNWLRSQTALAVHPVAGSRWREAGQSHLHQYSASLIRHYSGLPIFTFLVVASDLSRIRWSSESVMFNRTKLLAARSAHMHKPLLPLIM